MGSARDGGLVTQVRVDGHVKYFLFVRGASPLETSKTVAHQESWSNGRADRGEEKTKTGCRGSVTGGESGARPRQRHRAQFGGASSGTGAIAGTGHRLRDKDTTNFTRRSLTRPNPSISPRPPHSRQPLIHVRPKSMQLTVRSATPPTIISLSDNASMSCQSGGRSPFRTLIWLANRPSTLFYTVQDPSAVQVYLHDFAD